MKIKIKNMCQHYGLRLLLGEIFEETSSGLMLCGFTFILIYVKKHYKFNNVLGHRKFLSTN